MAAVLTHLSAILLALAGARAYFHSCDVIYSRLRGVFVMGFAVVFGATLYSACAYLHNWTLTSTMFTRSPEGRYDPI